MCGSPTARVGTNDEHRVTCTDCKAEILKHKPEWLGAVVTPEGETPVYNHAHEAMPWEVWGGPPERGGPDTTRNQHYDAGGISSIDVIKAKLTPEQLKGYYLGTLLNYSLRMNFKGQSGKDAEKCADYALWLNQLTNAEKADKS